VCRQQRSGAGEKLELEGLRACHGFNLVAAALRARHPLGLRAPNPGRPSGSGGTELLGRVAR
jgi:hypothetical protein